MSSGSHPPFPTTATSKPNLSSRPARCNTRPRRHNLRPRAAEGLQEPNAHCKRRLDNAAYQRCANAKQLSTMPPSCFRLLFAIRSGPLAKDRNSLVCPTNICRYLAAKVAASHLHENWACGTMNPPIKTRCRVTAPGRSDMSNIQPRPFVN